MVFWEVKLQELSSENEIEFGERGVQKERGCKKGE